MRTVQVGPVTLGEGMPKICVPVTGTARAAILVQAQAARDAQADICEWRADFYDALLDETAVAQTVAALRETLGGIPLLFTIRTSREGGQAEIDADDYVRLCRCAAQNGASLVDVEIFSANAAKIIADVHALGVPVIASSHDFQKTPPMEELLSRIEAMRGAGADISKIAVMPQSAQDVLTLLAATDAAREGGVVVTMAMGKLGAISRLSGETFGSAMTFGTAGSASAPGQIDAKTLKSVLAAIHGA